MKDYVKKDYNLKYEWVYQLVFNVAMAGMLIVLIGSIVIAVGTWQ